MEKMVEKSASVVDVFCGVGGLSHGFVLENFNVVAGIDIDGACKYAYEVNNNATFIQKSIEDVCGDEISRLYPEDHIQILVGCAPCQPFSSYNTKKGEGEQWSLVDKFADLILEVQPDIVSMENVLQLRSFNGGALFDKFVTKLEQDGYQITVYRVFCPDYGIPQNRRRLVVMGSKFGNIELIEKTHSKINYKTVKDTIGSLPSLKAGEECKSDKMHRARSLSEINLKRIQQSKPGGTWRDWEEGLVANCHNQKTGKSYKSVYGRMSWNEPSPTMTTQCTGYGNGRFGHPEQNRAITLREAALFQTFPSDYKFWPDDQKISVSALERTIGNAVPVALGQVIAKSINNHLLCQNL